MCLINLFKSNEITFKSYLNKMHLGDSIYVVAKSVTELLLEWGGLGRIFPSFGEGNVGHFNSLVLRAYSWA